MSKLGDTIPTRVSYSKLSTFSMCPRKAFWRYVMKLTETAEALLWGRATHTGQEMDNLARLKGGKLTAGQVVDAAAEAYKEEKGKKLDEFVKDHKIQIEAYHKSGERDNWEPEPDSVEAPFEIRLRVPVAEINLDGTQAACMTESQKTIDAQMKDSVPVIYEGFVDVLRREEGKDKVRVNDYKTVGRPMTVNDIGNGLQFVGYEIGSDAEGTTITNFIKTGKQKAGAKVVHGLVKLALRTQRFYYWIADTVRAWRHCQETGVWPKCSPTMFYCAKNQCEFYGRCYPNQVESNIVVVDSIAPVGTLAQPDWKKSHKREKKDSDV